MMNDVDIKNKRILLFDFDGTLVETASGGLYAKDLTDMKIKQDVVNRALDLMEQNGVKYFGIISNQCDVGVGFVSDEDIDAKINYVLRCVHDLAVKRGIRGVVYGHYECFSIDEYDRMMKPNPGMVYKALGACRLMMDGITYKDIETMKVRIKKDQYHEGYSDIIKIDKGDNNITFTSLYHESKESSDSLS